MPHIIIEHSVNAELTKPASQLLEALHNKLASFPTVEVIGLKSRIIAHKDFRVADGAWEAAFVHLRLELMTGRDLTLRQEMGQALMKIASGAFKHIRADGYVRLSLEVREMLRETYLAETLSNGEAHV